MEFDIHHHQYRAIAKYRDDVFYIQNLSYGPGFENNDALVKYNRIQSLAFKASEVTSAAALYMRSEFFKFLLKFNSLREIFLLGGVHDKRSSCDK